MILQRKNKKNHRPHHNNNIKRMLFYRRLKNTSRRLFIYLFLSFSIIFIALVFFREGFSSHIITSSKKLYSKLISLDFYYKTTIIGNKYTPKSKIIEIVKKSHKEYKDSLSYNDSVIDIGNIISDMESDNFNENIYLNPSFLELIKNNLIKEQWIRDVIIKRQFPDKITLDIIEYRPYVIWQSQGELKLVDDDGTIIPVDNKTVKQFSDLIIVVCNEEAIKNDLREIFNILILDPFIILDIESLVRIGDRRWDLVFRNGVIIKLPEKNVDEAWRKVMDLYNNDAAFIDLKVIDLRLKDKIYYEYKEKTASEIKGIK